MTETLVPARCASKREEGEKNAKYFMQDMGYLRSKGRSKRPSVPVAISAECFTIKTSAKKLGKNTIK